MENVETSTDMVNELFKSGGHGLSLSIIKMYNEIKRYKETPDERDKVNIQTIFKNKGSKEVLENYRGIFLASILNKMFERMLQIRIRKKGE